MLQNVANTVVDEGVLLLVRGERRNFGLDLGNILWAQLTSNLSLNHLWSPVSQSVDDTVNVNGRLGASRRGGLKEGKQF